MQSGRGKKMCIILDTSPTLYVGIVFKAFYKMFAYVGNRPIASNAVNLFQNVTKDDLEQIHAFLGSLLLKPEHTNSTAAAFKKEFLSILSLAVKINSTTGNNYNVHVQNCVLLAKAIDLHPDAEGQVNRKKVGAFTQKSFCRYTIKYFEKYPAPFEQELSAKSKKLKVKDEKVFSFTDLDIVVACYKLLQANPNFFRNKWNWSTFVRKYSSSSDDSVQW